MIKFIVKGSLAGLNDLIAANRKHRIVGNNLKRKNTDMVKAAIYRARLNAHKCKEPITINIYWYEKDRRRDKDNIASAKKYILDALVETKLIKNDGWDNISNFSDYFCVDKSNPRIEIEILEKD